MISFIKGNIFYSKTMAWVNPVNTEGIMGKGLALEFKRKFPDNFSYYKDCCDLKQLHPGGLCIHYKFDRHPKIIINFATKNQWKKKSKLEWINLGLEKLRIYLLDNSEITSLALPSLGCGNGGLDYLGVKPLILKYLSNLNDINIEVYEAN